MKILKVTYRGITWDNYQGGSGLPFNGIEHIQIGGDETVFDLFGIAERTIKAKREQFTEIFEVMSIEIINPIEPKQFTDNELYKKPKEVSRYNKLSR
jgi:hypothetical protein